jgi:hypothetical protein
MSNVRLRSAMNALGLSPARLGALVDVDAKTVERWITQDRIPRPKARARVAAELGKDETYFWPVLLGTDHAVSPTTSEITRVWPTRSGVPSEVWQRHLDNAQEHIDVLVYAAMFLTDTHRLPETLARLSRAGGKARILLGDPTSEVLVQRGLDEGMPNVPGRAASAFEFLAASASLPGIEIRLHDTALYASLYRFDQTLLVNVHSHGLPAKDSPVLELADVPGGHLHSYYLGAFDRVWSRARRPA